MTTPPTEPSVNPPAGLRCGRAGRVEQALREDFSDADDPLVGMRIETVVDYLPATKPR